jgi:hypothetical protein
MCISYPKKHSLSSALCIKTRRQRRTLFDLYCGIKLKSKRKSKAKKLCSCRKWVGCVRGWCSVLKGFCESMEGKSREDWIDLQTIERNPKRIECTEIELKRNEGESSMKRLFIKINNYWWEVGVSKWNVTKFGEVIFDQPKIRCGFWNSWLQVSGVSSLDTRCIWATPPFNRS